MAKIEIIYECENEIKQIIKSVRDFIELTNDSSEEKVRSEITKTIQEAFDKGREFQKTNPNVTITR